MKWLTSRRCYERGDGHLLREGVPSLRRLTSSPARHCRRRWWNAFPRNPGLWAPDLRNDCPANDFVRRVTGERGEGRVDPHDRARMVGDHDAIGRSLQGGSLQAEAFRHALRLGNVGDEGHRCVRFAKASRSGAMEIAVSMSAPDLVTR